MPNKEVSNRKASDKEASNIQSANSIDEQQLRDDEAFINSLYDEVEREQNHKQSTAQPSELLDRRIINAAHQVINVKPATNKKQSRLTWLNGLATAASLTLVISLVVQQQGQILPPADSAVSLINNKSSIDSGPAAAPINSKQSFDTEMLSTKAFEISGPPIAEQTGARLAALSNETVERKEKSQFTTTKILTTSKYEKVLVEGGLQGYSLAKKQTTPAYSQTEMSEPIVADAQQSSSSRQKVTKGNLTAPIKQSSPMMSLVSAAAPIEFKAFTIELFEQYKTQNNSLVRSKKILWSLIEEQKNSYDIRLYQADNTVIYYRLDKTDFVINETTLITSLPASTEIKNQFTAIHLNKP